MAEQKGSYGGLIEVLRAKPDVVKSLVADVQRAVECHRAILEGVIDDVVWEGIIPAKEGGKVAMEVAMEGLKKSSGEYRQLKEDLQYWIANYGTIQRYLFTGERLPIGPRR